MKITKLETVHVLPRWMFLRLFTDEGVIGYGEPVLEGKTTVVAEAVHVLGKMIIGEDPLNIEHLWQLMYRGSYYRGGPIIMSAISGIEQALWDIKGKYYNIPVWQMLGGKCRDRIKIYAHVCPGVFNVTEEMMVESAKKSVAKGFRALKMNFACPVRHIDTLETAENFVKQFVTVREAVGKGVDIAIDFHGRFSPAMAIRMCRMLEPYYPMYIEEPVLPENIDALVKVKESTTIPIATGERLFTKWGFREVIEKQAAAILQPDVSHVGGILETKKIAAMAENYYCSMSPHNPLGPIALASCLQVDTCIPNFTAQEHPTTPEGYDLGKVYFKKPFEVKDGYLDIPQGPGLGFEIDEAGIESLQYDGSWTNPVVYFEDDHSVGDW